MPGADILQLLHRRSDLGTYLVHLTRTSRFGNDDKRWTGRQALLSILKLRKIIAMRPLGMAGKDASPHLGESQHVACFTETPLEHSWMMVQKIAGREQSFEPYGLVFSKASCRKKGCNPVWYLNNTTGSGDWIVSKAINAMIRNAIQDCKKPNGAIDVDRLREEPIFKVTPFLEQMGTWPRRDGGHTRKEFWWEREWRHLSDFVFTEEQVVAVFAPEHDHKELRKEIKSLSDDWKDRDVSILDPEWGLERMIATLAKVSVADSGPFP